MQFVKALGRDVYVPDEPRIMSMPYDPAIVAAGGGDMKMADPDHAVEEFKRRGGFIGQYGNWAATTKARPYAPLDAMLYLGENGQDVARGLDEVSKDDLTDLTYAISALRNNLSESFPDADFVFAANNYGAQQTVPRAHVHFTGYSHAKPLDPARIEARVLEVPSVLIEATRDFASDVVKDGLVNPRNVLKNTYPFEIKLPPLLVGEVDLLHELAVKANAIRKQASIASGSEASYIFSMAEVEGQDVLSIGIAGHGIGSTEMKGVYLDRFPGPIVNGDVFQSEFLRYHVSSILRGLNSRRAVDVRRGAAKFS